MKVCQAPFHGKALVLRTGKKGNNAENMEVEIIDEQYEIR